MKRIKIIDLLNKIANNEEVPKKIKYRNITFKYDKDAKQYYKFNQVSMLDTSLRSLLCNFSSLNDEVEILEEEKKIPEKIPEDLFEDYTKTAKIYQLYKLTNEIIDYLESKEKGDG